MTRPTLYLLLALTPNQIAGGLVLLVLFVLVFLALYVPDDDQNGHFDE